jgi:hypothetical protein
VKDEKASNERRTEVRGQHIPLSKIPVLKSAKWVCERITGLSEERLLEHAANGVAPAWWIDGTGPWFRLDEVKQWVAESLITFQRGLRTLLHPVGEDVEPSAIPRELAGASAYLFQATTAVAGVYFLVSSGRVVYVGQSIDINSRVNQHRSGATRKRFDYALAIAVAPEHLDAVEGSFIRALDPPLNRGAPAPSEAPDDIVLSRFGMGAA